MILLDFSKAFDTVSHNMLCSKHTNRFKFSQSAVMLIKNYLTNLLQSACIDDIFSTSMPDSCTFSCTTRIVFVTYNILVIYQWSAISSTNVLVPFICWWCSATYAHQNSKDLDLAAVSDWAKRNQLSLNALKTQAILLTNNRNFIVFW